MSCKLTFKDGNAPHISDVETVKPSVCSNVDNFNELALYELLMMYRDAFRINQSLNSVVGKRKVATIHSLDFNGKRVESVIVVRITF
jgi:hypothetical protein